MAYFSVYVKVDGQWENLGIYQGFSRDNAIDNAKADKDNSKYLKYTEWRATVRE
ncbi:MAG: hypothetical protein WBP41_09885 [Saprospiraceae bacterium]